jgi:hypothetical protein
MMMTTWAEMAKSLASLSGEARELVRRATAEARHEERVERALAEALSGLEHPSLDEWLRAWGLLATEAIGCNGPLGLGGAGCATARLPCFSSLGKGRKQATDGLAWTAAIAVAQERCRGKLRKLLAEPELCLVGGGMGARAGDVEVALDVPPEWEVAVAGRGILAALGIASPSAVEVKVAGTAAEWDEFRNSAIAEFRMFRKVPQYSSAKFRSSALAFRNSADQSRDLTERPVKCRLNRGPPRVLGDSSDGPFVCLDSATLTW